MPVSPKTVKTQLGILMPLLNTASLKTIRRWQDRIGELMESRFREQVMVKPHTFANFGGAWVMPKDERRDGVILYLHGGGYTCGGLDYAMGFGSMLADQTGNRVFCCAYRLSPEDSFPAAVEDALESYRYLLSKGYAPNQIALCGESAGGGLCYALCLKLKQLALPLPCGIIAISPWTDLTLSGDSYETNREKDPSMTKSLLDFFAGCYTKDRLDPLASPVFGDLRAFPPSLIFVGGDEIMGSDAQQLHEKLQKSGSPSRLIIAKERWHGYLLYGLQEDQKDFATIGSFLNHVMSPANKLRWMPLDNAAKIYPAARNPHWSNVFRLSATLTETVDVAVLQSALDVTLRRFPSIAVRLRRGIFWYSLQHISQVPQIHPESSYPLTRMSNAEIRKCAFRIIVYKRRIAVEFFHSLTDGSGGLVFLKSLVAEYLQQKYGIRIPPEQGVLGRLEAPSEAELEDSFQKYAGPVTASRKENDAWHLWGTPESAGFLHLTCFQLPVAATLDVAHRYGVSLTTFLGAALMMALQSLQQEYIRDPRRRKPIKVQLPVNLRNLFPSQTLRNFALYTTPEILPQLGEYTFEEICQVIRSYLSMEVTPKQMRMKIAANVNNERLMAVRIMPLFLKNLIMKAAFYSVGEKKSCLSLSNLGAVTLPPIMTPYVERMDFILGTQATAPYNCGVLSFKDTLYINFIRNIKESGLEYHFYRVLQDFGLPVQVQSNRRE